MRIDYFTEEISQDVGLKLYGASLTLGHAIGLLFSLLGYDVIMNPHILDPVCWPIINNCHSLQNILRPYTAAFLLFGILASALIAGLFVLSATGRIRVEIAIWGLILIMLHHLVVILWDYRMKHNQHLMHTVIELAYLFIPRHKKQLILYLLPQFYFCAGLLKLTPEWWTGAVLPEDPWLISHEWVPLAAKYVIILETIFIWGLFSKNHLLRSLILAQLVLFHIASIPIVTCYYPIMMGLLLSIFFVTFLRDQRPLRLSLAGAGLIAVFWFFQVLPRLMTHDTGVTMQGRLFSLYMFDASVECERVIELTPPDGGSVEIFLPRIGSSRLQCEPVLFWNQVRNFCRKQRGDLVGTRMSATLRSHRSTDPESHLIAELKEPCEQLPPVSAFYNAWVREP